MHRLYRISIGITTGLSTDITDWIIERSSALGACRIWIGEDIGIGQDIFTLTAFALLRSTIGVGTAIIPISTNHIVTIARAGVALQEIGNGRLTIGIGVGGIQDLKRMSITIERPVTALREAVRVLKDLWGGRSVAANTELMAINDFQLGGNSPVKIPIFLGVRGPKMLRLAGQVADGVILSGPMDYIDHAMKILDASAKSAGRTPSDVERVVWLPTIPTFKGGTENLAKKVVAIVVADTPRSVMDLLDIDHDVVMEIKRRVVEKGVSKAVPLITREIMDMFAISGDCQEMIDGFKALYRIGADEVVLGPPFTGDWRGAMTEILAEATGAGDE